MYIVRMLVCVCGGGYLCVKEDTCVCVDVDTCVCAEEETCVFTDSECLLEVSRIAFGPKPYDKELVDVEFDGSLFVITTPSGFSKGNDENSFSLSLSLSLSPPHLPPRFIHT